MQDSNQLINNTLAYIKEVFASAEGGHDYWHTYRVWINAKKIASKEDCNLLVVELAALLHDIADSKFHNGDEAVGPATARKFLNTQGLDAQLIDHIVSIIENVSFKGGKSARSHNSIELDIVQDADRLEAIGAIGIARTFNYGGHIGTEIFNPDIVPNLNMTKDEYKSSKAPTINHFYEKLLLLKDLMNTKSGKLIAEHRHKVMINYLKEFYDEAGYQYIKTEFALN